MEEVVATLETVWALPQLLEEADPAIRHQVYKSLGINLQCRRDGQQEFVKVDAALKGVDLVCVGGGTCSRGPRPILVPGDWIELRRAG